MNPFELWRKILNAFLLVLRFSQLSHTLTDVKNLSFICRHSKSKTTIISQAAPTYGYPQVQPQMQFQPQMQQFQPASQGVSVIRLQ